MTPEDDKALIERIQGGDRAALGDLLRAHQGRLYHVCYRMVSHADDAAELTQDAMVKIVQSLDGFRHDAKFTTWMTRIAMNLCISHLRKRKHRHTLSIHRNGDGDNAPPPLAATLVDNREPGPVSRVQQQEMLDELQCAISSLDDDQRAVLVLRDLECLDYHQIARTLDLPVGTVKSRLFRARLSLRERLHPQGQQEPAGR